MALQCWVDIETFSRCDLKKAGAYRYAEDESTKVLLIGYAFDSQPAKVWDLTQDPVMPDDLSEALSSDCVFIAHNSMFDRNVLRHHADERFGDVNRWRDTMILAYASALPGSLGVLSELLGLPPDKAKDKDGRRLVQKFSKPQARGVIKTRETDPEDWAKFVNYCRVDVEAMRDVAKRIPTWAGGKALWDDWHLDQIINDRGVNIDIDTVRNAIALSDELKVLANEKMAELTDGAVATIGQRDAILKHVKDTYGVDIEDAKKPTLLKVLERDDIPEEVKTIIGTRLGAAVISIMKYKAMDRMICEDGTVKGTLQFMGASRTGRFAGRGLQLQNVARGILKTPEQVGEAIDAINTGILPFIYDDPNKILSSCLRGMLIPPPGRKFVVADLSNIEGRVLAWLAEEDWKIKAFELYDQGKGPDLYKATYARAFGIKPEDVTKNQRQIGKVMELALGYQGGVGAFTTFATLYGVDLDELAGHVKEAVSLAEWSAALSSWDWAVEKGITHGLSMNAYVACEVLKRAWRKAHPKVVAFWGMMEKGVTSVLAYDEPYETPSHVRFAAPRRGWLTITLPSGRLLTYPGARYPRDGERCDMVFQGTEQKTGKWMELKTHGGRLCICAGTMVLCRRGWTPIENVTTEDAVWDGEDWVQQQGAVCNGEREVIRVHGVWMTPDHPVLTTEGWIEGGKAQRHNRAPCRIPDGYSPDGVANARRGYEVGVSVYMRKQIRQARRTEPVYDLISCGPRHRFVVLGEEGPLIVHNCENVVQAVARDVLVVGLHEAEKAGFHVHAHVHDEIIASAPIDSPFTEVDLARCMTTERPWMRGLPLSAAGFTAMRYRKE